ncbi:MAG: HD domain-containing protein [Aerococcus sp.]|nr:HD domain-containing protein [Aerococcus sp.]
MTINPTFSAIPEKVFRDPVHSYIHIQHQVILDLINTREFQRLRRIKQLGYASYVFHGGLHNRFSHCLGVYEIARHISSHFERNYPKTDAHPEGWDSRENLVTLCAALLHDIGHGAFSHTFEKIFETDHEAITREIILNETTEVHQVLAGVSSSFPNEVAAVINHSYPNRQVVQLISSQIDADRMDYLLRDSYYTGVSYGKFDLMRIIRTMQPAKDGIRFKASGMHAVEDYIESRYQMYMQVYFHPVIRSMEILLTRLLARAKTIYPSRRRYFKETAPFLVPFFENEWTLQDYLNLDDSIMETYFMHWMHTSDDAILTNLAERVINRKPFKSVIFEPSTQDAAVKDLAQTLKKLGYDTTYYLAANESFDAPYHPEPDRQGDAKPPIELIEKDGTVHELSVLSPLVQAFSGQRIGDARLFFPSELVENHVDSAGIMHDETLDHFWALTRQGSLHTID